MTAPRKIKPMLAWHFAPNDMRLANGDGRKIIPGKTLSVKGELSLCNHGLHASRRIIDALQYAANNQTQICRVEVSGDVVSGDDKLCGTRRKCLWAVDADHLLHEFACRCAEDALALIKTPDQRSFAAIKAKRNWLAGNITEAEMSAAKSAAWSAAKSAAESAAKSTAESAAKSAAKSAAWSAQNHRLSAMVASAHRGAIQ